MEKIKPYLDKTDKFFEKKSVQTTALILLVLLAMFIVVDVRLAPAELPIVDTWAQESVRSMYIQQIEAQLRQEFPTLPAANLRNRANQEYERFRQENIEQIRIQEQATAQSFRRQLQLEVERPDGSVFAQTYLTGIDPWHYLHRAERILETGTVCTHRGENGECMEKYFRAPLGRTTSTDWHGIVQTQFLRVAVWMGYIPMTGAFYMPAIIALFMILPAFFIVARRYGSFAGFIAALVVGLHVSLLTRTMAGFADTDPWTLFFPLFMILALVYAIDNKQHTIKFLTGGILAGILTATYSRFWTGGWWFAFFTLLIALLAIPAYYALREAYIQYKKTSNKQDYSQILPKTTRLLTLFGIYFITTAIFTTAFSSFKAFTNGLLGPFARTTGLQNPLNQDLWPNVLTTVAELNVPSLTQIINSMGGTLFVLVVLLGLIVALLPKKLEGKDWGILGGAFVYLLFMLSQGALQLPVIVYLLLFSLPFIGAVIYNIYRKEETGNAHYAIIGIGFFLAGLFANTQGVRFQLLTLPGLALGAGFFTGWILDQLGMFSKKKINYTFPGKTIAIVLVLLIFFLPTSTGDGLYNRAQTAAESHIPMMNDAWWDALTFINQNSSEDAIITSWWDFGHWFKYIAERRVTFDGASQNTPQAHWVGHMFQTIDYTETLSILRMLNCGANTAYERIHERTQNVLEAYRITDDIIGTSSTQARSILEQEGFSTEEITSILEVSHCTPPESYVIVSEDMVGKSSVWGHFGGWDFERAYVAQQAQTARNQQVGVRNISETLGISETSAQALFQEARAQPNSRALAAWISTYPSYVGERRCSSTQETTICDLSLDVGTQQGVQIIAQDLVIPRDNPQNSTIRLFAQGQLAGTVQPLIITYEGEEYIFPEADFNLGIRIREGRAVIGQPEIFNSVFTQLFFDEDPGEFMQLVTREVQFTGGKILVYKVDWDAYLAYRES